METQTITNKETVSKVTERISGSEAIVRCLIAEDIKIIYGYPGGAIMPVYDELYKYQDKIHHVLARHEQGATHAAQGFARISGEVGVAIATSGPGATNLVTGIADAQIDSTPMVCITGQVASHLLGSDAFQETDIVGISTPVTKWNCQVTKAADIPAALAKAFYIAKSGRPGPVLVDITKDAQFEEFDFSYEKCTKIRSYVPIPKTVVGTIEAAAKIINAAKKPLIVWGQGIVLSKAEEQFKALVEKAGIPAAWTILGASALPTSHPLNVGMLGMHGNYAPNKLTNECDVLIAIGMRFDDRVTGRLSDFAPAAKKIQIDIDRSSINKNVFVDIPLVGDAANVLEAFLAVWKKRKSTTNKKAIENWWEQIERWRKVDCLKYENSQSTIKPQYALQRLHELTKDLDVYFTTEVGQHQMWAAQFLRFDEPRRWMTSGGLGTMGYGFPAAMGVQIAHPKSLVIDVAGEASFLMNMQELSTVTQYRLPVKVFIMNNEYMGMVRQWQGLLHGERYSQSWSESLPDFVKLAEAFGAKGILCSDPSDLDDAIMQMLNHNGPVIFDCLVDQEENCFPMIPSGKPHNQMLLGPKDQEENKITGKGKALV